jgi:ABC-type antimicrobial peptide transport system permease subunit
LLAVKLLLRQVDRTVITVLMVVPVVTLLVSSNLVASGYLQQATAVVDLVRPSETYLAYQAGSASPSSSSLSYDSFLSVKNSTSVTSALPLLLLLFPTVVNQGRNATNTTIIGTDMSAFIKAHHSSVYGRVAAAAASGDQADAGAILEKMLNIKVGDNVTVVSSAGTRTLTIVGILNSTDQSDTSLIIPLTSAWSIWPQTSNTISEIEFASAVPPASLSSISSAKGLIVIPEQGIDQIALSFGTQTTSLLTSWTYILLALAAAAAVAAAFRIVSEVSQEYMTIRALGGDLWTARRLVFQQLSLIALTASIVGACTGLVMTMMMATMLQALVGLPAFPGFNLARFAETVGLAFALVLGAGSLSLLSLPRKIGETGDSR